MKKKNNLYYQSNYIFKTGNAELTLNDPFNNVLINSNKSSRNIKKKNIIAVEIVCC